MFFPDSSLREEFEERIGTGGGYTEPWTLGVVAALLIAKCPSSVLELGTYIGYSSQWLCHALATCGGNRLFRGVEIDPLRAKKTRERLARHDFGNVKTDIVEADTLQFLRNEEPFGYEFAWVDADHDAKRVEKELFYLINEGIVAPGGIICMHDVDGPFGLDALCEAAGGYVLKFPKLHVAGGLGVIQV
jgi:predicted O-methyltransferase YrrM